MEKVEKSLSIAFINQTLDIGGAETFNCDLLEGLTKAGIQIKCFITHPPFAEMLQKKGIPVQHISVIMDIVGNWKGLVKACVLFPLGIHQYFKVLKQLKKESVDLVLLSGFTEKIFVSPWAKFFDIPVVWIEFGPISPLFSKFFGLPKLLYRLVKNIPSAVIAPSQYTKSDIIPAGRLSLGKLWLIPCGRALSLRQLKPYLSLPIKKHQIACVSRLEDGKGQDLLIQALPAIVKKYPDTQLLITGRGGTQQKLQQLAKKLKVDTHIQFVGWVPDVLRLMAESEVCVFPSVWPLEGFGLVTIEAMALKKPVVAFRTGPTPEIITHAKNGLLANPGDRQDLERQILSLFENKKHARSLGEAAHKTFFEQYNIEPVVQNYISVFKDVVSRSIVKKQL